jgi:hypothetical protein
MNPQRELYTVKHNDTLWKIARDHNTTVEELKKLNGIKNPNALHEGQKIALHKEAVGGFRVLLLDKDRNPLQGVNYRLNVGGKRYTGETSDSGEMQRIVTDSPYDVVHICVQRIDGSWKEVAIVMSGFGDKLTVLVSGHIKVRTKTEKHPDLPPNTQPDTKERPKPKHGPDNPPKTSPNKSEPGALPQPTHTPDGKPITPVEGDIPNLDDFLDSFNGEVMEDSDYAWAARELGVEEAAIRAYARVESGADKGGGYIVIGTRKVPTILYERHKFSKHTNHQYSKRYPDISLPNGYYVAGAQYVLADEEYKKKRHVPVDIQYYRPINKADNKSTKDSALTLKEMLKTGKASTSQDTYLRGIANYKRLIKAYQLNKNVALMSCSWGAFQIMGEYWETMGYPSIVDFTKAMSRSEKEQIKAFIRYIKKVNPAIIGYLKNHDWARAAEAYNGPSYKQNNYDYKLESEYKKLIQKK